MKKSIDIPEYIEPSDMLTETNHRLWREYGIYHAADADMCLSLLDMFGSSMDDELTKWLREVYTIRKEQSEEGFKKSSELSMKLFIEKRKVTQEKSNEQ